MECPNCQAIENGVWKRFEHGNPQQAQDMEQDTNSIHDRVPAMVKLWLYHRFYLCDRATCHWCRWCHWCE